MRCYQKRRSDRVDAMNRDCALLARKVGALTSEDEVGGTKFARLAIAEILGDTELVGGVYAFLRLQPGSELARNVLSLIKPRRAMEECHAVFERSADLEERQLALALLADFGDRWALRHLGEYLEDPDPTIQAWGAKIFFELALGDELTEEELEVRLRRCKEHRNPQVRETAAHLREALDDH